MVEVTVWRNKACVSGCDDKHQIYGSLRAVNSTSDIYLHQKRSNTLNYVLYFSMYCSFSDEGKKMDPH